MRIPIALAAVILLAGCIHIDSKDDKTAYEQGLSIVAEDSRLDDTKCSQFRQPEVCFVIVLHIRNLTGGRVVFSSSQWAANDRTLSGSAEDCGLVEHGAYRTCTISFAGGPIRNIFGVTSGAGSFIIPVTPN